MQMTRNILKVYRQATPEMIEEGTTWYPRAFDIANDITGGNTWMGAGLLAAYSPLTPWDRNVELATDTATSGIVRTDTLTTSWRKAERILNGEAPMPVLNGMKTQTFCENIATAGQSENVTVDVHAFSIAHYKPIPSSQLKMGKGLYRDIETAYRRAAKIANVSETEMQAITWIAWRILHPPKRGKK